MHKGLTITMLPLLLTLVAAHADTATPTAGHLWTLSPGPTPGTLAGGFLDAATGVATPAGTADLAKVLPHASSCRDGEWRFSDGGREQGSTMFRGNATLFILAEEVCDGKTARVVLLGMMGPFPPFAPPAPAPPPPPPPPLMIFGTPYASWNASSFTQNPLSSWNILWDSVCNVVVLAPESDAETTTFQTLMVSEYDRQVRPQTAYSSQPMAPTDGAVKVAGVAALQFGGKELGWPTEGNCGDCSLFTLEAQLVAAAEVKPRHLIGRAFHSAELVTNVTDSLQIQTLSQDPRANDFYGSGTLHNSLVGIGLCCVEDWCDAKCAGHDQEPVLIAYSGGVHPCYILAFLFDSPVNTTRANQTGDLVNTARLGVMLTPVDPFGQSKELYARVAHAGRVYSYVLVSGDSGELTAVGNGSAAITGQAQPPWLWQPLRQ